MMNILENVFVQIPNFIFLKNTCSEFVNCNANFANAAALRDTKDIIGKTDFDMPWAESHAELYREGDREVLEGDYKFNYIETQLKSNGEIVTIIINKTPLINDVGEKIGIIGSYMEAVPKEICGEYDSLRINIPISKFEADYLYYIAQGKSLREIAEIVEMSMLMTKCQIESLKKKLNTPTDVALQKKALSLDIVKSRLFGYRTDGYHSLTKREIDIVRFLIKGKTAKGIALELQISNRTVENNLATIKAKMNVSSKSALIQKLLDMNI